MDVAAFYRNELVLDDDDGVRAGLRCSWRSVVPNLANVRKKIRGR
ncbi:MAG TPA: hypothetical protein VM580_04585 [Labilithrix sp.]|nr:hypothetical protein [Labilithrix sp.]